MKEVEIKDCRIPGIPAAALTAVDFTAVDKRQFKLKKKKKN